MTDEPRKAITNKEHVGGDVVDKVSTDEVSSEKIVVTWVKTTCQQGQVTEKQCLIFLKAYYQVCFFKFADMKLVLIMIYCKEKSKNCYCLKALKLLYGKNTPTV